MRWASKMHIKTGFTIRAMTASLNIVSINSWEARRQTTRTRQPFAIYAFGCMSWSSGWIFLFILHHNPIFMVCYVVTHKLLSWYKFVHSISGSPLTLLYPMSQNHCSIYHCAAEVCCGMIEVLPTIPIFTLKKAKSTRNFTWQHDRSITKVEHGNLNSKIYVMFSSC